LLSQHPHAIRFWLGDRKQYKADFGLMEEIVCLFRIRAAIQANSTNRTPRAAWKFSLKCSRLDSMVNAMEKT